ncbi:MAG: substrate-binding domain-containing protein [Chloroflexales bacterium]|nr:substrate-binding domain-containing protein [Chloroflexales bacterium]
MLSVKRTAILALLLVLSLLTACGQQAPAAPDTAATTPDAVATTPESAAATPESAASDASGGAPTDWAAGIAQNPPDMAGQPITIIDVPKLTGIPYFAATAQGMQEAAAELGNVTVTTDAPTEARIERQIEFIDNFITQQPDAIVFAANDPVAISPVLRRALDQGIRVVGYDAGSDEDAREFFVNQATFEAIGKALIDEMVKQVGEEAEVAIVTSSLTAPNQNRWIEEMTAHATATYPNLQFVTTLPSEEDQQLAFRAAQDIMKTYPNVKGIFGLSSVAFPGATDAVKQAGNCGQVAVVGLSTPKQMSPFMQEGCIQSVVLWNPVDLGYATAYAVRALVDGAIQPGATELESGRLGTLEIRGSEILLGAPFIFTPENIDDFDF